MGIGVGNMGCSTSKLPESENAVMRCKERRLLMKQAVEQRYEFAEAHAAYMNALKHVGSAVKWVIEGRVCTSTIVNHLRAGSAPTPPSFFLHIPPPARVHSFSFGMDGRFASHSSPPLSPPPPSTSTSTSAWDLFNPFISLDNSYSDQRRLSVVDEIAITNMREEEGIPALEEEKVQAEVAGSEVAVETIADVLAQTPSVPAVQTEPEPISEDVSSGQVEAQTEEEKGGANDNEEVVNLEKANVPPITQSVWQDMEHEFMRAYEFGKDVSALLEVNKGHHSAGLSDLRVHSARILSGSISLIRSLSRSSSSRTYVGSTSSKDDTDDSSSDFADDYRMISGSHVSTLDRIYAWEKKLYDEVKCGECLRINYEKKCMQLRNQDDKGEDPEVVDKTRVAIKNLHTRIKVSIHSVDSISKRIQKLSSEELQPQLAQLIKGLMEMWRGMFECHQIQYQKITYANSLNSVAVCEMSTESRQQATGQLENALHDWHRSFSKWFSSQKAYVQAIYGWLSKCIMPDSKSSSNARISSPQHLTGAPPVFIICRNWYHAFGPMPEKLVIEKIDNFALAVHALREQQDKELRQKKTAEYHSKDLDRVSHQETAMHQNILDQTQNAMLRMLTGMESTFDALTQFASVAFKEYKELYEKNCCSEISHI